MSSVKNIEVENYIDSTACYYIVIWVGLFLPNAKETESKECNAMSWWTSSDSSIMVYKSSSNQQEF